MDWIGDVSNFVMGATAHFIATVTTKILSQPDVQDVFAETIALVVQKLLIQGDSSSSLSPEEAQGDDDHNPLSKLRLFQKQQKQALRLLGKCLLKMGESSGDLSRGTEEDDRSRDLDIAESHTDPLEEEEEEEEVEQNKDETTPLLLLQTKTVPKQEPARQETPTLVEDDLGKVVTTSFGTVETHDTADEDYEGDPLTPSS